MLSTLLPAVAHAAPTPSPTLAPTRAASPVATPRPLPARAPAVSPVPSVSPGSKVVAPAVPADPSPVSAAMAPAAVATGVADHEAAETGDTDIEPPVDWQAYVPTDVADHLATMDRAARDSDCGVPWQLLASISRVESDFGRNMATSSAGAIGYGQFLPSSWQAYGNAGNVYDYRDALPAIATYLCQAGLERDPRTALFAYNHADWYVDLVLDLAVRYDRMAPGAPTPDVLGVGPATEESGPQLRYAPGRNLRLQAAARAVDSSTWLGVPWQGRTPSVPISFAALESTSLAMVRGAFGLTATIPRATDAGTDDEVSGLADFAWQQAGLLALPIEVPVSHLAADRQPPQAQALLSEIRRQLSLGRPVIALLEAASLPGHASTDPDADQPVVVIGQTLDGLVVTDPSFSSSLGYGLELKDSEFVQAWQAASTPLQALAFTPHPRPLPRDAHLREAEPPPVGARIFPTPTPLPTPPPVLPTAPPLLLAEPVAPTESPVSVSITPGTADPPTAVSDDRAPVAAEDEAERAPGDGDRSWVILVAAGGFLAAAFVITRVRARRRVRTAD